MDRELIFLWRHRELWSIVLVSEVGNGLDPKETFGPRHRPEREPIEFLVRRLPRGQRDATGLQYGSSTGAWVVLACPGARPLCLCCYAGRHTERWTATGWERSLPEPSVFSAALLGASCAELPCSNTPRRPFLLDQIHSESLQRARYPPTRCLLQARPVCNSSSLFPPPLLLVGCG